VSLILLELAADQPLDAQQANLRQALPGSEGQLVEAFAAPELTEHYFVFDGLDEAAIAQLAERSGLRPLNIKAVRLVGEAAERTAEARYLVEWDLPEGLTMAAYLQRKAEKTPLYAQVPEAKFFRTYVCEDMSKCLCLYDAPDEAAVRRARAAVGAPVTRLSRVANDDSVPS